MQNKKYVEAEFPNQFITERATELQPAIYLDPTCLTATGADTSPSTAAPPGVVRPAARPSRGGHARTGRCADRPEPGPGGRRDPGRCRGRLPPPPVTRPPSRLAAPAAWPDRYGRHIALG